MALRPSLILLLVSLVSCVQAEYNSSSKSANSSIFQAYVFCQNCYKEWSKHLPGAEVGMECRSKLTGRVAASGKGITDEKGYLEIKLDRYDYRQASKVHTCVMKIIKSRDQSCDFRTNVNSGYSGAEPVFSKVYNGAAYFTTKGFSFTPMCSY